MLKKIFCYVLAATFLSLNVLSQENEKKQKQTSPLQYEIVVTATRLETPSKEIASSIIVITKEDIERLKKTSVLEVLQEVLGVFIIQNGATGSAASIFLRGANSEHTLVMMDGVELNDPISPSRSYDFAHLSIMNIERIEILSGPQSTLYGSDALGGVINIITKKGLGKPRFHLTTHGGSYRTFATNAEISGSTDRFHFSLGTSSLRTDGFSAASTSYEGNKEADGYQNLALSARFGFRPLDNLDFDFTIRTINTKTDIDNFGGAYGDDPNNVQEYDAFFLKGKVCSLLLKNRWEQILGFSLVLYDRHHENRTDSLHPFDTEDAHYKSKLFKIDWQHNVFLHETNTLIFGLDYQQEQGESEYYSDGFWGPYSSIFPTQKAHTLGIYLQDQIKIAPRFFATAGIRLDDHSQFGKSTTFRLASTYFIEKTGTKINATYGTGFKSPSLYQIYAPGTFWGPIGNEDLEPEKSTGWDLGVEQQIMEGKILFGARYFSNIYKNLIQFDFSQGYTNIGKAESKGKELFIKAQFVDNLLIHTTYTRTEAKDKDENIFLLRRPKDKFSLNINYRFTKKANINLSIIYIGERDDMEFLGWTSTRIIMPSYTLLNATCSYDLLQNVQIFIRLDNILNEEYEMIKGYGTPGFSTYGGFKIHF